MSYSARSVLPSSPDMRSLDQVSQLERLPLCRQQLLNSFPDVDVLVRLIIMARPIVCPKDMHHCHSSSDSEQDPALTVSHLLPLHLNSAEPTTRRHQRPQQPWQLSKHAQSTRDC